MTMYQMNWHVPLINSQRCKIIWLKTSANYLGKSFINVCLPQGGPNSQAVKAINSTIRSYSFGSRASEKCFLLRNGEESNRANLVRRQEKATNIVQLLTWRLKAESFAISAPAGDFKISKGCGEAISIFDMMVSFHLPLTACIQTRVYKMGFLLVSVCLSQCDQIGRLCKVLGKRKFL